jgi:hypothetical protein
VSSTESCLLVLALAAIGRSVVEEMVSDSRNSYRGRVADLRHRAIVDRIAECLRRGELLDLAPDLALGSLADEGVMRSWDGTRSVAAEDLRNLLRGRVVTDPDPRGLRLRGARIRGRLDMDNLTTTVKLTLLDCLLDEGITAEAAHLTGLSLRRCLLTHLSKPALYADELRTDGRVSLAGSTILASTVDGAIRMIGARIGGELDCSGVTITNPSGAALHGEHLQVAGNVSLRAGFTADGDGELGAVRLAEAQIGGHLDCSGAIIRNSSGPALRAGGALRVAGRVFLREGFIAHGFGELGAVRLVGAHIGGDLSCFGATITNPSGPALHGEHLQIAGNLSLRGGFTADGFGELGAVRLAEAHIGGHLDCTGAIIRNPTGPALQAGSALQVAGRVFLREGFTAHGAGELGTVRLVLARIGGQLDCSGATIRNPSGPALFASNLQTGSSVLLHAGFTADGDGEQGVVRLIGARIGGRFDCSGAVVKSRSDPQHRWALDGLTYTGLPLDPLGKGSVGWLDLFRTATPAYAAQPYQQLASVYRAAGHDRDVRLILIAQRQAQLDRGALTGRGDRLWARITGITLGYGYQAWRALLFLLGVVVTSVMLAVILGAHGGLAHPQNPKNLTALTIPCTVTEQIDVGLKIGAPFLDTHADDRCTTTNTATGIALSYSISGLRLLTGALAALFLAGFTSVVRKA